MFESTNAISEKIHQLQNTPIWLNSWVERLNWLHHQKKYFTYRCRIFTEAKFVLQNFFNVHKVCFGNVTADIETSARIIMHDGKTDNWACFSFFTEFQDIMIVQRFNSKNWFCFFQLFIIYRYGVQCNSAWVVLNYTYIYSVSLVPEKLAL